MLYCKGLYRELGGLVLRLAHGRAAADDADLGEDYRLPREVQAVQHPVGVSIKGS